MTAIAMLGGIYGVSMSVGRWITGPAESSHLRRGWRRPFVTLLLVIGAVGVMSFVAAISASRWYWGYWMWRPAMDERVASARRVVSATHVYPIEVEGDEPARLEFSAIGPDTGPSSEADLNDEYPFRGRDVLALRKSGAMPRTPATMPVERLRPFYDSLQQTGVLDAGEYGGGTTINATVLELEGLGGKPLIFVSARGDAVSNDHFPYYEFLFSAADPAKPALLSWRRFYYDVAGMEGTEWYVIGNAFFALAVVGFVPLTILIMSVRRLREWRRLGGGFPVEMAPASGVAGTRHA